MPLLLWPGSGGGEPSQVGPQRAPAQCQALESVLTCRAHQPCSAGHQESGHWGSTAGLPAAHSWQVAALGILGVPLLLQNRGSRPACSLWTPAGQLRALESGGACKCASCRGHTQASTPRSRRVISHLCSMVRLSHESSSELAITRLCPHGLQAPPGLWKGGWAQDP